MADESDMQALLSRMDRLLERIEGVLPPAPSATDWSAVAFRWRRNRAHGWLQAVAHPHGIRLQDLQGIDRQKAELDRNTRQFVERLPANNALLSGSRGTGKSSLVKALLNGYSAHGLRLIEVDKQDLMDLPEIVESVEGRDERFLLFCDDLSFEADDASYKALKAVLDGSVSAPPDNLLLYATSNRRHLLPEYMAENEQARNMGGEIHHGEAVEEKISLSERFGLWLSFYPFNQVDYLAIVGYWLTQIGAPVDDPQAVRTAALQWAQTRGSRSGRSAWQFARDWAGRTRLADPAGG